MCTLQDAHPSSTALEYGTPVFNVDEKAPGMETF